MIKLTFLGTSDAFPSVERNHTSILLSYKDENILIDCGEGTQRQFRKARLNPHKVTRLLITHWHGDHVLGIPGLLQTLVFNGYNKTLFIYGPKGIKENIKKILELFPSQKKLEISIQEVNGKFFENEDFFLEAEKMTHGIPCNAYTFVKKDVLRIDKKKLEETKLQGPVLKQLKNGKDISYQGKKYKAKDFTYLEKGKKISFVLDTSFNDRIIPFVKNSDLLICESTFGEDLAELADEYKHLTVKKVAEIAKKSKSKKLVLTHISQRYSRDLKLVLDSCKKIFKNSVLAKDFDTFEI